MHYITAAGRQFFATAVGLLGVIHLVTGNFPVGLLPVPASLPARLGLVYLTGAVLTVTGVGIGLRNRKAALAAGLVFGLFGLLLHAPKLLANPTDGRVWTALFELVALTGGALLLAGSAGTNRLPTDADRLPRMYAQCGRLLVALSLFVFGGLHFVYGPFIAALIPGWIPGPLFWAYFVGVAFVATGISTGLTYQRELATFLLGIMFLLWVLLLHAPRAVTNPHVEPEWTSLLIALAMSGVSFVLTGTSQRERQVVDWLDVKK